MKKLLIGALLVCALGCASGHCPSSYAQTTTRPPSSDEALRSTFANDEKAGSGTVKIFKADGSKQCGMGKGVDPSVMEKELSSMAVLSREKGSDGLFHITSCGAATGQINIYEIKDSDWSRAEKLGFRKLSDLLGAAHKK